MTHVEEGHAVNPLAPKRLTPYRDTTVPAVLGISVSGRAGKVDFAARAVDMPSLPVPGRWHGFPVSPALVTWRVERRNGRIVAGWRTARDVRRTVPANDLFWDTFARGTHQNWPVFDDHKQRGMTGQYLFRLTVRPFDTTTLANGSYVLVVIAEDTAGNRGIRRLRFEVANGLSRS